MQKHLIKAENLIISVKNRKIKYDKSMGFCLIAGNENEQKARDLLPYQEARKV